MARQYEVTWYSDIHTRPTCDDRQHHRDHENQHCASHEQMPGTAEQPSAAKEQNEQDQYTKQQYHAYLFRLRQ